MYTRSIAINRKERIFNQIEGKAVDRIPMLGGWIGGVHNLARIAEITVEEYMKNPIKGVVRANKKLNVDGMVTPVVPKSVSEIRQANIEEISFINIEPEALKERADLIPETEEEILSGFSSEEVEQYYHKFFEESINTLDGIVYIPTLWDIAGHFSLYGEYGYRAFLTAVALYPQEVAKIFWENAIVDCEKNKIIARLIKKFDLPPLLFSGPDIADNKGPLVSPQFLRTNYWPYAKHALKPFVEAGIRLIRHCDGNIMPVYKGMIDVGYSGFQGFQYELGVNPYEIKKYTSSRGEKLLFFGGLSVTRTLPFGSIKDVEEEVKYILDYTDGGKGLFLFTSNVTGVEVPPENIIAAYRYMAQYDPNKRTVRKNKYREWPWKVTHS